MGPSVTPVPVKIVLGKRRACAPEFDELGADMKGGFAGRDFGLRHCDGSFGNSLIGRTIHSSAHERAGTLQECGRSVNAQLKFTNGGNCVGVVARFFYS